MRLALDWFGSGSAGVAAREVQGSVWFGALKEAQVGNVGLGRPECQAARAAAAAGAGANFARRDDGAPADDLRGAATMTRNGFGFDDVTGRLQLTAGALGPLRCRRSTSATSPPLRERLVHRGRPARCARWWQGDVGGIALPAGLTGTARCDAGALLLAMGASRALETVELRMFGDGRYVANVLIRSTDAALRDRMGAAGLTLTPQGYGLNVSGQF
jgi:general secretion pathway protein N